MSQDLPQPTTSEHLAGPDERSARRPVAPVASPSPSWRSSPAAPRRLSRPRSATRRAPRTARSSTRRAVSRSRVPSSTSTGTTTDPAAAACSATARRTRGRLRHDAGAEPDDLDRDEPVRERPSTALLEANGPASRDAGAGPAHDRAVLEPRSRSSASSSARTTWSSECSSASSHAATSSSRACRVSRRRSPSALLADVLGGTFARLQFTPDLMPGDIVGTRVWRPRAESFDTELGPVFANLVLADEINRAPAKVQSALLEAMWPSARSASAAAPTAAASVPRHGHPEPHRVRGRLPAARGPARPLPAQGRRPAPQRRRGA